MNNDSLIDQARQLYAILLITRYTAPIENSIKIERLNNLIILSYSRYVRRLNRCVVCYQYRSHDCKREPGKDHTPCQRRPSKTQDRQKSIVLSQLCLIEPGSGSCVIGQGSTKLCDI